MHSLDQRITQFENMTRADPENDMAHFSLGNAYAQAGRFADAAASFKRCLELNPDMSKAYQLAGEALINSDRDDEAVQILDAGYRVAAAAGDLMPRNAIAELLRRIGREPPRLPDQASPPDAEPGPGRSFVCRCTGRPGTRLPDPPMRGPVGRWIYENISAETWRDWLAQGTKVINELSLDLSREADQKTYDQHMCEYLGLDDELHRRLLARG